MVTAKLKSVQSQRPKSAAQQWHVIPIKTRVDAFNQEELAREIQALRMRGCNWIALDLTLNRFLSLPTIKFCVELASELGASGGALAFVGCQQKTKRHLEIYGSTKNIQFYRQIDDLSIEREGEIKSAVTASPKPISTELTIATSPLTQSPSDDLSPSVQEGHAIELEKDKLNQLIEAGEGAAGAMPTASSELTLPPTR